MSDEIVTRLRGWSQGYQIDEAVRDMRDAADEIERLHRDYSCICGEMRRMMDERDEVRQSYCSLMEAYRGGDGRVTANKLGWGYLFPRRPKKEDGK